MKIYKNKNTIAIHLPAQKRMINFNDQMFFLDLPCLLFVVFYKTFLFFKIPKEIKLVFTNNDLSKFYFPTLPNMEARFSCCMGGSKIKFAAFRRKIIAKKIVTHFWKSKFNEHGVNYIRKTGWWLPRDFLMDWHRRTKQNKEINLLPIYYDSQDARCQKIFEEIKNYENL